MKNKILAPLGAALIGISVNANADQTSNTLNPTLTVSASCVLDTTNFIVDLGTYPEGTFVFELLTGTIDVQCPDGLAYMVGVNGGLNPSGNEMQLLDPVSAQTLGYYLVNVSTGFIIGDAGLNAASGGTYTETYPVSLGVEGVGNGAVQQIQTGVHFVSDTTIAAAGTYSDTTVLSVVW